MEEKEEFQILIPSHLLSKFIKDPMSISPDVPLPEQEKRVFLNKVADILSGVPDNTNYRVKYISGGNIEIEESKERIDTIKVILTGSREGNKKDLSQENETTIPFKIKTPSDGREVTVELKPGIYYIGRNPTKGTIEITTENGEHITTLWDQVDLTVSRNHLKVKVTEDGKIFIQDYGKEGKGSRNGTVLIDENGNTTRLNPGEEKELKFGTTIKIGENRFTIEKGRTEEKPAGRIKDEIRKITEVSKHIHEPPVLDYIRSSEKIAREAIKVAKTSELEKYAEETGRTVSITTESAFTSLYLFVLNNRSKLSGNLHDIRRNILLDNDTRNKFVETVRKMIESVETFKDGKWVKNDQVDELTVRYIADKLLKSNVFLFKLKWINMKIGGMRLSNPDPIRIMEGYAEAIRTVGIISPVLTQPTRKREIAIYLERLEGLLTGKEKAIVEFEKPIVKFYKMDEKERNRFTQEVTESERAEKLTHNRLPSRDRRREVNLIG